MFFKCKKYSNDKCKQGLEIYNSKEGEPQSSVMESIDYDFAVHRYNKSDFRFTFISKYIKYFKENINIEIFNCKFERPRNDSNFINFYIYLWKENPDVQYRIEENTKNYVKVFYEILKNNSLPGITETTNVQFLIKNILTTMISHSTSSAWHNIHNSINSVFPKVSKLSYWNVFYVFINDNDFESVVSDTDYLYEIRLFCYKATKACDMDNVVEFNNFHIRIDNFKNYQSIGGQHYFNSDLMSSCLSV